MNLRLARSIYSKPWLIHSQSALAYLQMIEEGRLNGLRNEWMDDDEEKQPKTIFQKLFANYNNVVTAPIHRADTYDHPGYEGKTVGVLPVIGPLMKEDFCGWFGTASLKSELQMMKSAKSMKAIMMIMDSPGGTVDGTQSFADEFKNSDQETITVVDGMMCSAGYWIGSGADKVIATSKTDIIGCIGTMIAFYDYTKMQEDRGIVLREYYATDSKDKNKDLREAKKGKGDLLIESTLDPLNDVFLDTVRNNRGEKLDQKQTLTGKTFVGEDNVKVGLIDSVESLDSVLSKLVLKHSNTSNFKFAI
jgi:ClpP class serine protease